MYVLYIFMNGLYVLKTSPTSAATALDRLPASSSWLAGLRSGLAAASSLGRNDSMWNWRRPDSPLKTILRSASGTTVSFDPIPLTSASAGLT